MSKHSAGQYATLALLTGMSLVVFLIENQLPSLFLPGAKLGLANLFSLLALVLFSPAEALLVVAARTLLGALFAASPSVLLYSFTGGMAGILVSAWLLYGMPAPFSLPAVSVTAAVVHNLVQNIVFVLVTHTVQMLFYLPYLALAGVISGACVGLIAYLLVQKIPLSLYERVCKSNRTRRFS